MFANIRNESNVKDENDAMMIIMIKIIENSDASSNKDNYNENTL